MVRSCVCQMMECSPWVVSCRIRVVERQDEAQTKSCSDGGVRSGGGDSGGVNNTKVVGEDNPFLPEGLCTM
jgi:hypothetical protein